MKRISSVGVAIMLIVVISLLLPNTGWGYKFTKTTYSSGSNKVMTQTFDASDPDKVVETTWFCRIGGEDVRIKTETAEGDKYLWHYKGGQLTSEEFFGKDADYYKWLGKDADYYKWVYTNGSRDYAIDKDGKKIADAVYWGELEEDGYFDMNVKEKEDYLSSKCSGGNIGITELRTAIDEVYQSGKTNGFTIIFAKKDDGSTVPYSAKFYDRNGNVWKEIGLYNVATSDSDGGDVSVPTITPPPADKPKDKPGKTIEEIKSLPTVENYSGDDEYDPAAGGLSIDDLDEEEE